MNSGLLTAKPLVIVSFLLLFSCGSNSESDESNNDTNIDTTNTPDPLIPDAARANSYDDAWEAAWIANVRDVLTADVGITKTEGKVLQVGDSMTFSFAYGDWARKKNAATATASDLEVMNWMHAGVGDLTDGWKLSSDGTTAMNNANWGFVDNNFFANPDLIDAQFAVVMFNVNDITFVKSRINEFIDVGIVPVLSTIPPRTDIDYNKDKADPYNLALLALAEELSLPIIDFSKEILLRRPNGTWEKTLIGNESGTDGVHPSGGVNGYTPISDPYADGGDVLTHTTGDATLNSGYLLRTWLTVQKIKEIKAKAID